MSNQSQNEKQSKEVEDDEVLAQKLSPNEQEEEMELIAEISDYLDGVVEQLESEKEGQGE